VSDYITTVTQNKVLLQAHTSTAYSTFITDINTTFNLAFSMPSTLISTKDVYTKYTDHVLYLNNMRSGALFRRVKQS
jgi:hypothetical protein